MRNRLLLESLAALIACVACTLSATPESDRLWATRITCELQTAGPVSLPALYWQQGTSPLLSLDQYRSGRAVDADTNVTAVLRLAPTATNLVGWVSVTNYATVGNGYLVQMPSIGTNTAASGAWFYTAYFIRGTAVYWTGSGRLTIAATTSTGADGLVWQEILPPGADLTWDEITGKPATFPPETHSHDYTAVTNPPWLDEYTETDPIWTGVSNTITVGAALGATAVQAESDPVAMAALEGYQSAAYWPPNATASSWFTFITNSGAITITGYNIAGGTDVVIPDYINGLPVTKIGAQAFEESGVKSIGGAGNVVTVGGSAFVGCYSLASVLLPQVQTVGDNAFGGCISLASVPLPQVQTVGVFAFYNCTSLASVQLPQVQTVGDNVFDGCTSLASLYFDNDAPTIEAGIFAGLTPNQVTNYVTNPQATGWGDRLGGMPVVRLDLHGDKIYQAGELVATFSQIAASNALPYTAWTGTVTPVNGTATVTIAHGNMPVLVIDAPTVLQLDATGFGTSGVSRVSLSYYTGTNALTFATNIINYAETPTVDTNGWNTLLIRRVANSNWKGVGL